MEHLSKPLPKKEAFKRRTHFKIRDFLFEPPQKISNCWNLLINSWLNGQTLNHFKVNQKNLSDATLLIIHFLLQIRVRMAADFYACNESSAKSFLTRFVLSHRRYYKVITLYIASSNLLFICFARFCLSLF